MPRKNPFPDREKKICERLQVFRRAMKLTRVAFAQELGMDSSQLANYEHGRAPLRYGLARNIAQRFGLNLQWLAEGIGHKWCQMHIFKDIVSDVRLLFSQVYDLKIKPELQRRDLFTATAKKGNLNVEFETPIGAPSHHLTMLSLTGTLEKVLEQLPFNLWGDFRIHIENEAARFGTQITEGKNLVDNVSETVKLSIVKPMFQNLLRRLKTATSARGKKSELAKFLGVSLVQVSQWLSGDREPGGETTLRMLHWVEQQERQK